MNSVAARLLFNALLVTITLDFSSGNDGNFTGSNWAVLIAGSKEWNNYRHQADVCHAYQILRKHGIPQENIITFMYNDIAHNSANPYPGKIFNNLKMKDVYKGVIIDYEKEDVSKNNIINVLLGNEEKMKNIGSGRVLKSGPGDNVFIYYTDHGSTGTVRLPGMGFITYEELLSTLEKMHANKQFENLLFYLEACFSGSMFEKLPKNINVYATTAANASTSSWPWYCKVHNLPCLGDLYSINWMENTEEVNVNKFTVKQQYEEVKKLTTLSEVCQFGDYNISRSVLGDFFGSSQPQNRNPPDSDKRNNDFGDAYPSTEHDFHYLHKQLNESEPGSAKHREIVEKIISNLKDIKHVKERMEIIAKELSRTTADYHDIVSAQHEVKREHGRCFKNVLDSLINGCFETESEKEHIFEHTQKIMNMCSQAYLTEDKISHAIDYVCSRMEHEKVELQDEEDCWMGQNICNILCSAKGKQRGSCSLHPDVIPNESKCICE